MVRTPSADECVEAGMYYFGLGQALAAKAWWERALRLDPKHSRAREMLAALERTQARAPLTPVPRSVSTPSNLSPAQPSSRPPAVPVPQNPSQGTSFSEPPRAPTAARFSAPSVSKPVDPAGRFGPPPPKVPSKPPGVARAEQDFGDFDPTPSLLSVIPTADFDASSSGIDAPILESSIPSETLSSKQISEPPVGRFSLPKAPSTPAPSTSADDFDVLIDDPIDDSPAVPSQPVVAPWDSESPKAAEQTSITPWDSDLSATPIVTMSPDLDETDAIADDTPAPILDRDPLFVKPPDEDAIADALGPLVPDHDARLEQPVVIHPEAPLTPSQIPEISPDILMSEATDRLALDDFEGALRLLERMPPDHVRWTEAKDLLEHSREKLQARYASKLGSLRIAPQILLPEREVMWLSLNHRAGFLLSQIDGTVSYEDLLSLSGMPRLDTLRLLFGLLNEGVIGPRKLPS